MYFAAGQMTGKDYGQVPDSEPDQHQSKVKASFLRKCVIPPGRVAAERTLALARQAYMRVSA